MRWWRLKCTTCKTDFPSCVVVHFGFDKDGTLHMEAICRICLHRSRFTHTAEEIAADHLYAHQQWLKEHPEEMDFQEWESELEESDE